MSISLLALCGAISSPNAANLFQIEPAVNKTLTHIIFHNIYYARSGLYGGVAMAMQSAFA